MFLTKRAEGRHDDARSSVHRAEEDVVWAHNLVKYAGLPWGGTRATGGSVGRGEIQSD